jgi:hypothetical protein
MPNLWNILIYFISSHLLPFFLFTLLLFLSANLQTSPHLLQFFTSTTTERELKVNERESRVGSSFASSMRL